MTDTARVRYRGLMAEKFLARVLSEGIKIQSIERRDAREMILAVSGADAEALLAMGRRFSLDIVLLSGSARDRIVRTARRRMTLLPALLLCAALLVFFASRVWLIEIQIDETVTGEAVITDGGQALRDGLFALGVRAGISRAEVDTDALSLALQREAPDYAFIGIRLNGVRLLVEAVRELPAPDLYDIASARDLVASADAIITRVNALTGVAGVKPGDTVRRGQVLIRGEERVSAEVTRGVCALGEVTARCWVTGEAESDIGELRRTYTGRGSLQSELRLMDFTHTLKEDRAFEQEEVTVRELPVGGLFLPLKIVSTQRIEYEERYVEGNLAQIQEALAQDAMQQAISALPEACVIVDKWIDYSMIEGDRIRARVVIELERNIAVPRSALLAGGM